MVNCQTCSSANVSERGLTCAQHNGLKSILKEHLYQPLKFRHSENTSKIWKISYFVLTLQIIFKKRWEIFSNFKTFSQYLNFTGFGSIHKRRRQFFPNFRHSVPSYQYSFYSYLSANFDPFLPLPPSQLLTSFRNGSFWWNILSWKHSSTKLRMLLQKGFHPIVLSFDLRGTPWNFSFNIHHHLSFFVTALLGIDLQKKRV